MTWRDLIICGVFFLSSAQAAGAREDMEMTTRGPLVSLELSAGAPNDPTAAGAYDADMGFETGWRVAIGYGYENWRLEGQIGFEKFYLNNLNPQPGSAITASDTTGDLSGPLMMGSVYYDFGTPRGARPFLGAGIGFAKLKADYHGLVCFILCQDGEKVVGGSDTALVWQAMAGVSAPMKSGLGEWYLGYRYLETGDVDLYVIGDGPATQEGMKSHSLILGWRFELPTG